MKLQDKVIKTEDINLDTSSILLLKLSCAGYIFKYPTFIDVTHVAQIYRYETIKISSSI